MACLKAFFQTEVGCPTLTYYICDTIAELPASGIQVGDIATTLEGPKIYLGFDATTWREITKAGTSGYAGTGMLGSGTANSTNYLRGDNTWATPSGGGGSATLTETEVDFSYPPQKTKSFTVTDAAVTASSKIMVSQSGSVPTDKGIGESELDSASFSAIAGTGQFTLIATALDGKIGGTVKAYYLLGA